jgi:hypothetical protein
METTGYHTQQNVLVTWTKSGLSMEQQTPNLQNNNQVNLDLQNPNLGHSFQFQH